MSIDPDELKERRIKREKQVDEIQKYLEKQDTIDQENSTGKLGHRTLKRGFWAEKISHIFERIFECFKGKSHL